MISFANAQGSVKIRLTCSRVLLSLFLRGSLHALFNSGVKFARGEISPRGETFFVYMHLSPLGETKSCFKKCDVKQFDFLFFTKNEEM